MLFSLSPDVVCAASLETFLTYSRFSLKVGSSVDVIFFKISIKAEQNTFSPTLDFLNLISLGITMLLSGANTANTFFVLYLGLAKPKRSAQSDTVS